MRRVSPSSAQSIQVYRAADWRVVGGVNEGDCLSFAAELLLDDSYALRSSAEPVRLALASDGCGHYRVAPESDAGQTGAALYLDCTLSLMAFDGAVCEAIVLVETDRSGHAQQVYLLPLSVLDVGTEYRLVGIETETVERSFAQVGSICIARGTRITLGSGRQRPIEDLKAGDAVLTRDDGVQTVRWIGHMTQRAIGAFAPIRISAGTLNNARDLLVSSHHRLFIYQRSDLLGAGRSELLVRAGDLENGTTVTRQEGGFVEYFQLLFDSHQIVYAEGIAAESMLVDARTAPLVDADTLKRFRVATSHRRALVGTEVQKAVLQRPDAVEMIRHAAQG